MKNGVEDNNVLANLVNAPPSEVCMVAYDFARKGDLDAVKTMFANPKFSKWLYVVVPMLLTKMSDSEHEEVKKFLSKINKERKRLE
jgi:hypothetical protein